MSPAPNPSLPPQPARRASELGGPARREGARGRSRIAAARARLESAKIALSVSALVAFGISIFLARGTNPGGGIAQAASRTVSRAASLTAPQSFLSSLSQDNSSSGSSSSSSSSSGSAGTVAPAQNPAPAVSTGGS